jgi:hypothetical protein
MNPLTSLQRVPTTLVTSSLWRRNASQAQRAYIVSRPQTQRIYLVGSEKFLLALARSNVPARVGFRGFATDRAAKLKKEEETEARLKDISERRNSNFVKWKYFFAKMVLFYELFAISALFGGACFFGYHAVDWGQVAITRYVCVCVCLCVFSVYVCVCALCECVVCVHGYMCACVRVGVCIRILLCVCACCACVTLF